MKIKVEDEGYLYTEGDPFSDGEPVGFMALKVEAGRSLLALRAQWDKMTSENEPILQYAESAYPVGIVLEIEGTPMGVVRMVDDFVQYIPFNQSKIGKTEEST